MQKPGADTGNDRRWLRSVPQEGLTADNKQVTDATSRHKSSHQGPIHIGMYLSTERVQAKQ